MKQVDCEIIRDLLPSYIDKTASESTNKLIGEHLQECNSCNNMLNEIINEDDTKTSLDQKEQIDYLKGYKRKMSNIICSIIIIILILLNAGILLVKFLEKAEFYININDMYIDFWTETVSEGKNNYIFNLYDWKERYICTEGYQYEVIEDNGVKDIYVKVIGKYPFGKVCSGWATITMDNTIDKIYFEDKRGNKREIWSKDIGLQSDS